MINELLKFRLSALIGVVLGGVLIAFVEPETAAGASVLGAIGLIPSLIIGYLFSKLSKARKSQRDSDSSNTT